MNEHLASRPLPVAQHRLAPTRSLLCFKQQLILLFLIVAVRLLSLYAIPEEVGKSVKVTHLSLPVTMAGWKGRDMKIDPAVYAFMRPDDLIQKRFAWSGSGSPRREVEVLVMYSRDATGFHPPDVCMKSQGWILTQQSTREVKSGGKSLLLNLLTGEQREQKKLIAYSFTDATGTVSGRTATVVKMVMSRFLRRRMGALEIQFAYDTRVLRPDGDFDPQFKALMLKTAETVYAQLKAQTAVAS